MAKDINTLRTEAQQVQNATQVGENTAQRVGGVLTDIVDKAEEHETGIDNLNANTGVDEYPEFSTTEDYSAGDVVNYNGKLYKFTADHAAGAWTGTDAEETDIIKAHIVQELGDSETTVISQKTIKYELSKTNANIGIPEVYSNEIIARKGNIATNNKWSNISDSSIHYHYVLNIEKFRGKKITVHASDYNDNRYSAFLKEYNIFSGKSVIYAENSGLNTSYPNETIIPSDAKCLYLYCSRTDSPKGYADIRSIEIDGIEAFTYEGEIAKLKEITDNFSSEIGNVKTDITSVKADIEELKTSNKGAGSIFFLTNNTYANFIKELYIINHKENIANFKIRGIKRNYNGSWQFTIRAEQDDSEILVYAYIFNDENKEKDTLINFRFFQEGVISVELYFIINWDAFTLNTQDNNTYILSDVAFDINMSPTIKSHIEKQDKLISGTNIKTINGQSILGSGDIKIEAGGNEEITNITNNYNIVNNNNNYSIGSANVGDSLVERKTLFGSSVTIKGSVSNELPKISIFSKPNIEVSGTTNNITFPVSFNLKVGNENKNISNINNIRSIKFTSDKNTKVSDFTYSDDEGAVYISDSIEIYNGKYYYTQRVEEKVWHTGEDEPEIYLSNKVDGLVDGATIYVPKSDIQTQELGDISISVNNGDVITTDNASYLYLQIEELTAKKIMDNPIILTKISELTDKDGITVKGRNVAYDENEDVLYICAYSGTLYKVDVSNDKHPKLVAKLTVNSTNGHVCTGCAITDNYIYAVDRNEGQTTKPSYLTVIRKSDFSIIKQIDVCDEDTWYLQNGNYAWGQSPCMCAIDKRGYLFIPENQNFWDIYDIKTDPENPEWVFRQIYSTRPMDINYREYQSVDFLNVGDKYYAFFAGWTSGVSIWDVTDVSSPNLIGQITLIPWNKRAQTMDVLVEYPYLYIPCGAGLGYRFMHHPLNRSVIMFDISDLSKYSGEIDYLHNPELFTVANIPYDKFYPNITREGDPAPTRITKTGDFIAVNYAEAGTAIFRMINGIPVFQSCYQLAGKGNTIQPLFSTKDGRLFQVNIYGNNTGMQIYRLGNVNY